MANTSSARKAARQALRRTEVNKARRSRMRSAIRNVEEAIASGDRNKALEALDTVGWDLELAESVLTSVVSGIANADRMEEANSWRNPIDLIEILETRRTNGSRDEDGSAGGSRA